MLNQVQEMVTVRDENLSYPKHSLGKKENPNGY
jgi:hypothetical protein